MPDAPAATPAELADRARTAYRDGDLEATLAAWEGVHAHHLASGDRPAAAAAATTLAVHLLMDTGLMAPVRGWVARAERLLEGGPECGTHAWLAMVRAYERLLSGDLGAAGEWAERAIDVGSRLNVAAPAAVGRVAAARLRILEGRVEEGLGQLDEAATAALSNELDPVSVGIVYCEVICALQGLAQHDRAGEWTEAMERWRHGQAIGSFNGRCRVHRAEMLRLRGSCQEAEVEARHACEELRPWLYREYGWPLTELGTIRLRRGDLAGAEEAFRAAHEHGWDPQPGWALVRAERGQVAEARAMIRHALTGPAWVPSKERPPDERLRRAPLLEAEVVVALLEGDQDAARRAADELATIAGVFLSRPLGACARAARARVRLVDGDAAGAAADAGEAVATWLEVGAPFEAASARLVLADALQAGGDDERAALERRAAQTALDRLTGAAAPRPAAVGPHDSVFRAEGDTRTVAFGGRRVVLRDLKGMRYLARMLAEPGREFHVLDLVAGEGGPGGEGPRPGAVGGGDLGPALDGPAREALRRRLREIDDDLDEAAALGDAGRAARAQADRDYIVAELARAFGLGGRARVTGSSSERARASVTRALRYALDRVGAHHVELADHLARSVRTGTYCAYDPDPALGVRWAV